MSTTTTDRCWCGAEAVLFAVGGDLPPQQWCEEHQPDDPYEAEDFIPDPGDEPAAPAPAPAVAAARGLMWLAEACRDLGVDPVGLEWFLGDSWEVHVDRAEDIGRLADHLGLPPRLSFYGGSTGCRVASREGDAWDMHVRVYGPAEWL